MGVQIKRIVEETPTISYRNIPALLKEQESPSTPIPSVTTIYRFLKQNGVTDRNAQRKIIIRDANKQKRIDFAQEFKEKPLEFWSSVIWSDETKVEAVPQKQRVMVKVHKSVKKQDLPVNQQLHSGGFSVMFWGCFVGDEFGPLVPIEGTMKSLQYSELLRRHLLPIYQPQNIFMQDNAPCHVGRLLKDLLETHGVRTLKWPAQSPDLNPIENLWAILKQRRQQKYGIPMSRDELIEQMQDIW